MSYSVQFSDKTKSPIIVADGSVNTVTSIGIVGQNARGYGQVIAEDLIHLLENFASPSPPDNAIEGQLWYNTSDINHKTLMVKSGPTNSGWYPASNIFQQVYEPAAAAPGAIWVDLSSNQLKIYDGAYWTTVGPDYSGLHQTGAIVETVLGSDGVTYPIIKNYVDGNVVSVFSVSKFVPNIDILGFSEINPGLNVSTNYEIYGVSNSSKNLNVGGVLVDSNKFLRNDISQTINAPLTVNDDSGISVGGNSTSTIKLIKQGINGKLLSVTAGSKIILSVGAKDYVTIDSKDSGKITASCDVQVSGKIAASSAEISSSITTLSINTENLLVSGNATLSSLNLSAENSSITVQTLYPKIDEFNTSIGELGSPSKRWKRLWVETIDTTETSVIKGTADSAVKLVGTSYFSAIGQAETISPVVFDGSAGNKVFNIRLTYSAVTDQIAVTSAEYTSWLLVVTSSGLRKITKQDFLKDLVHTGTIMLWHKNTDVPPDGWVFCNGASYSSLSSLYVNLFNAIGISYGTTNGNQLDFFVPNISPIMDKSGSIAASYIIKL